MKKIKFKIDIDNRKGQIYENFVSDYIKDYFIEKDVIGLKSYDIFNLNFSGKREIDILLLHREYGIIIIEVKGLHIRNINSISGDNWMYKDFYIEKGNPYKQAENQLRLLMNHLKKIDLNLANKLGQKIIVALPLIRSEEWEKKGFNDIPNCPPIIFKDDFLSSLAKEKIKNFKIVNQHSILTDNEWKKIQDIFGVNVSIEPDVLFDVEEPLQILNQYKKNCDYSALYSFSNENNFIKYLDEMRVLLKEGKKVFLFINFEIPNYSFFKNEWSSIDEDELKNLYQLQVFINKDLENFEEFIIYDGNFKENKTEFFKNNFPFFNWEQFQIVHAQTDKNLIVKAGAGTGKTHVMIDRIIFLLLKNKISLNDIIMITFTNESTQEMKERLKNKFLDLFKVTKLIKFLEYAEETNKMQISTIHSFFKNIIVSLSHHLGYGNNLNLKNFKHEKNKILDNFLDNYFKDNAQDIHTFQNIKITEYEFQKLLNLFWGEIEKKALLKEEIENLDWGKGFTPESEVLNNIIKSIFIISEDELDLIKRSENSYTVDDLIRKISTFSSLDDNLLLEDLNIKEKIIFIDEFQDTDNTQIKMMIKLEKLLKNKLFVVGDIKQSIYRFRGANYTAFDKLTDSLNKESVLEFSLQKNYRTSRTILEKLDSIFNYCKNLGYLNYDNTDKLLPMKKSAPYSTFYIETIYDNDYKDSVVEYVNRFIENIESDSEYGNRRVAVIVRRNSDAKKIKKILDEKNIKSMLNLDGTFFKHSAIKDLLFLINLLIYPEEADHLINGLQTPYFGYTFCKTSIIGFDGNSNKIVQSIYSKISKQMIYNYVNQLKTMPFLGIIQKIISENNLENNLLLPELEKKQYLKNLSHLLNIIIKNFSSLNTDIYGLKQWLELKISTDRTENEPALELDKEFVVDITTVHRAKGLEYHSVIIPYTNNSFNFVKSSFYIDNEEENKIGWFINGKEDLAFANDNFYNILSKEEEEVISEEARLLYVAMTRAIQNLVIFKGFENPRKREDTYKRINYWKDFLKEGKKND